MQVKELHFGETWNVKGYRPELLGGVSPDDFLMGTSRVFLSGVRTLQDNQYVASHNNT